MIVWTVVIVVLSVAILLSALKFGNDTKEEMRLDAPQKDDNVPLADKDTDLDGLPDWKEALLGFDPGKSDTDGDGIFDKEEADTVLAQNDTVSPRQTGGNLQLPFGVFPEIDKNIRVPTDILPAEGTGTAPERVRITKISPSEGVYGTEITITGEGFSGLNTLYTGYGVFRDISSFDGKTIRFTVEPAFAANSRGTTAATPPGDISGQPNFGVLPFWMFIKNENGTSNGSMFRFYVR